MSPDEPTKRATEVRYGTFGSTLSGIAAVIVRGRTKGVAVVRLGRMRTGTVEMTCPVCGASTRFPLDELTELAAGFMQAHRVCGNNQDGGRAAEQEHRSIPEPRSSEAS